MLSRSPDFDIYADKGPHLVQVCSAMIALSATAVALRFLARRLSRERSMWDDWLILIALPLAWVPDILMIYCVQHFNFGKHLQWATASDVRHFWIYFYACNIIHPISAVLIKCSILCFLYRVLRDPQVKICASIIGVASLFWGIITLAVTVCSCNPVKAYWDTHITAKACVDAFRYFLGTLIPNIILDAVIIILPLPFLWRSHITLSSHKAGLLFLFALGGFVIITAILRLHTIAVYRNSAEFTYNFIDFGVWTAVETNTGIVCACLATMRPLIDFAAFGILDTERSTHHINDRMAHPSPESASPEPAITPMWNKRMLKQWPRHNAAPPAPESGGLRPIRKIIRRGRHTASSSWGFNQPLPPDFLDEPLPPQPENIRELVEKAYRTKIVLSGINQPIPPGAIQEHLPISHEIQNEDEYSNYRNVERTESEKQKKNKVAGVSRFNAFDGIEDVAREERSRRMRRKMAVAGWPMSGEQQTWI